MGNVSIEGSGWILLGLAVAYFVPTVVALIRRQSNITAIFLINLFFGWTAIGWIIALWLAKATDMPAVVHMDARPDPEPTREASRSFAVPEDLYERVSDMAGRLDVPLEEVGRLAIVEFLDRKQAEAVQKDAGATGGA